MCWYRRLVTGVRRPAASAREWVVLGVAFVAIHVFLGWLDSPNGRPIQPAGDVTGAYRFWVDYWRSTGVLVGVNADWVYPIGALPPMLLAGIFGDGAYLNAWLVIVAILDGIALVLLARRDSRLAWWWLAFTLLLGPVALVRIDAIALPIAIVGVLHLASRPAVAAVLFTIAAWVKVWPAAILAAVLLTTRRITATITATALTCVGVIGLAVLAGANGRVFSFITAQATRGIQIEAPVALPWLWSAALGDPTVGVYYDTGILTFQLRGSGVAAVASVMTPLLAFGVLLVTLLALLARRRGAVPEEVLAVTALGYVSTLIAFNKVGSPQYMTWYVAPVLLGLLAIGARFHFPAVVVLLTAGLTQLIYPWFYNQITSPDPAMIGVLTLRNALELVLFGWCLLALRTARVPPPPPTVVPVPGTPSDRVRGPT